MESLRIALRLVHIVSGISWVGAAFFLTLFLEPTVRKVGAAGGQVMEQLVSGTPFMKYMIIGSLLTVATGVTLYGLDVGLGLSWVTSREGLTFTIGSLAGLGAYATGAFAIGPLTGRIGALGRQMATAGGPPSPLQLGEMASLQARATRFGRLELILMAISIVGMAGARMI